MTTPTGPTCDAVSDTGLPCQKKINEKLGFHGGGHMFVTDELWARLSSHHFDAVAALSGLPFTTHTPDECPGPPECWQSVDGP